MAHGDGDDERPDYEYKENLSEVVDMRRGTVIYFGHLDADGAFFHNPGHDDTFRDRQPFSSLPKFKLINMPRTKPTEVVYEYRSARLIKGILNERGVFVPDLDSKVTDFKDFKYNKTAPRIYNLPGAFVEKERKR